MAYQFETVSVLIVEDNQPLALMIKSILQTFGIKNIEIAANGRDGFTVFCRMNPDIVIADWMMKPKDGIDFTYSVRTEAKSPNPFAPVILITGFSEKKRVIEARDAGVTEFLVKPFQAKDLYKRIAQVIERPRQFVKSYQFFGPDRRRSPSGPNDSTYAGPWRRGNDHKISPKDNRDKL